MAQDQPCIAIYSRKSRFTGSGESICNQVMLCRTYIAEHYGTSAAAHAAVYEDEGFSGGNTNRPAFRQMIEQARARQLTAIVVYRLDRISRSISDFSVLIEELGRLGVAFISIREQFDTASPMGRAMLYIASIFSQLEREIIAERIRDNMHELAKTGRWLGGMTPTGFTSERMEYVTVDGKTRKACRLQMLDGEACVVRQVYDAFLATHSLTETEAQLRARGVITKTGRLFTRFAIRALLKNPVYLTADGDAYDYFLRRGSILCADRAAFDGRHGVMPYHRTDQTRGTSTAYLPVQAWIIAVGAHPGLISSADWLETQRLLEANRTGRRPCRHTPCEDSK